MHLVYIFGMLAALLKTMRYLSDVEIMTLINLGKTLEMFLGQSGDNKEIIEWLSLVKGENEQIEVHRHAVFDEGDMTYLDLYSFTPVDPDLFFETKTFPTLDHAVAFIKDNYKPSGLRFVNQGVIQDEYRIMKEKDNV